MLKSITMKNVATYDNVGVTFNDLNRVNLIFGPNGTGKTTISTYLTHYSNHRKNDNECIPARFRDCQVDWNTDTSPEILVYNRTFKKENIGKTTIPGVFIMGKRAIDNRARIQSLLDELQAIRFDYNTLMNSLQQIKDSYLFGGDLYQSLLAVIDANISRDANDVYPKILDGYKRDNNKRIEKILEIYARIESSDILSEEEIRRNISIVNEKAADILPTVLLPELNRLKEIEASPIWAKVIIGSGDIDFAGFINSLNLSDWVRQGINKLHATDGICPFCQQHTITDNLIEKFNGYFNDDYKRDVSTVEELVLTYKAAAYQLIEHLTAQFNDTKYAEYFDSGKLKEMIIAINRLHKNNIESMEKKSCSPSDRVIIEDGAELYRAVEDLVDGLNKAVSDRNALIAHKNKLKSRLPEDVWNFLVARYRSGIEKYYQKREAARKEELYINGQLDELGRKENNFNTEISELRAQSSDSTATIERINNTLKRLQFNSFRIESHDESSYRIVRKNGDDAAQTLSEGEETLISFLYYIHLLDGSTDVNKGKQNVIAVIDDPISSLDNGILSFVAREIKNLMYRSGDYNENIKQVIILTHNISFHKSLSTAPIAYDDARKKKTFYILDKDLSTHQTYLKAPSLKNNVESEYNALWNLLRGAYEKIKNDCDAENKEYKYTIQNTMRRIYETFFSNTCGLSNNDIAQMFPDDGDKKGGDRFRNFIEWINEGSHSASMNDISDLPSDGVIQMYMDIFEETFKVTGNHGQYKRLMKS